MDKINPEICFAYVSKIKKLFLHFIKIIQKLIKIITILHVKKAFK